MNPLRIVILGGGFSGLTTAHFLKKICRPETVNIKLLEGSSDVGGWIKTKNIYCEKYDVDQQVFVGARTCYLSNYESSIFFSLVSEYDFEEDILFSPNYRSDLYRYLYYKDKLVVMPQKFTSDFLKMYSENLRSGTPYNLSFLTRYLIQSMQLYGRSFIEPDRFWESMIGSFGNFVKEFYSQDVLDYLYTPMIRGIYGCNMRDLDCKIFLREYQSKIFSKDFINLKDEMSHYQVRNNLRSRFDQGSRQHELYKECAYYNWDCFNIHFANRMKYWGIEDGFYSLLSKMAVSLNKESNMEILTNKKVKKISASEGNCNQIITSDGSIYDADIIISAIPANQLNNIMEKSFSNVRLPHFEYSSMVSVTCIYDKNVENNTLEGFGYLVPDVEYSNFPVSGCIFDNNLFSVRYTGQYYPVDPTQVNTHSFTSILNKKTLAENNIDSEDQEQILKIIKKGHKNIFGFTEEPLIESFESCDNALPIFKQDYTTVIEQYFKMMNKVAPNMYFVGNIHGYVSLNSLARIALQQSYKIGKEYKIEKPYKSTNEFKQFD